MKRISLLLVCFVLFSCGSAFAQDAALEERLNRLEGKIEDLIAAKNAQNKQLEDLARRLLALEEQQSKPNANYATPEELKRLGEALKEVDRKRIADNDLIIKQISDLGKTLSGSKGPAPTRQSSSSEGGANAGGVFMHVVAQGDTVSAIAKAYREQKNIRVTVDDILAANPGLDPKNLRLGQTIKVPSM